MTLVVAIAGVDCVGLAADGQATGGEEPATRSPVNKLGDLHGRIAFGFSGGAGLRQRIIRKLNESIAAEECGADIAALRPKLHAAVNQVQHEAQLEEVREPSGKPISRDRNVINALFAGVSDNGEPWIYEVAWDGKEEEHEIAEAIGSGRVYAISTLIGMRFSALDKQKDEEVALLAYRVVAFAIATAARDLGEPINLYIVRRQGADRLTNERLELVQQRMIEWQQQEREVFGELAKERGLPVQRRADASGPTGIDIPPDQTSPSGESSSETTSSEDS